MPSINSPIEAYSLNRKGSGTPIGIASTIADREHCTEAAIADY